MNTPWLPSLVYYVGDTFNSGIITLQLASDNEHDDDVFSLSWQAFGGEGYQYQLEYTLVGENNWQALYQGSDNSYSNNLSLAQGSYQIRILCQGATGCPAEGFILLDQVVEVFTAPQSINSLTAALSAIRELVTLTWSAVSNVDEYIIEYQTANLQWQPFITTATVTQEPLSAVEQAINYRIKACNRGGCNDFVESGTFDITPFTMVAPGNTNEGYEYQFSWPENPHALSYAVGSLNGAGEWQVIAVTENNSIKFYNKAGVYQYRYQLCRDTSETNCGVPSDPVSIDVINRHPESIISPVVAASGYPFTLRWPKNHYADQYVVETTSQHDGGGWQPVTTTTDNQLTLTITHNPGSNSALHHYRYKTCSGEGNNKVCGPFSGSTSVEISTNLNVYKDASGLLFTIKVYDQLYSETPDNFSAPIRVWGTNFTMTLPEYVDTDSYLIEQSTSTSAPYNWQMIAISDSNVIDFDVNPAFYFYRYSRCNKFNGGIICGKTSGTRQVEVVGNYNLMQVTHNADPVPENMVSPWHVASGEKFTLQWPASGENSTYLIQKTEQVSAPFTWESIAVSQNNTLELSEVNGDYFYRYAVCESSFDGLICSPFSSTTYVNVVNVTTIDQGEIPHTIMIPEQVWTDSFTMHWPEDYAASYYQVQEQDQSNVWRTIASPTSNLLSLTKATGRYQYRYRICLNNEIGASCGDYSDPVTVTVANLLNGTVQGNVPDNIKLPLQVEAGVFNIDWPEASDADAYLLQENISGLTSDWLNLAVVDSNSWYLRKAGGSYQYRYAVCQQDNGGLACGPYSNSKQVEVINDIPAIIDVADVVIDQAVSLTWPPSINAVSYIIEQKGDDGVWSVITTTSGNSYNILNPSGIYQYRYRACTDAAATLCGQYSDTITVSVLNSEPVPMNAITQAVTGEFTLSWPKDQFAESYLVQELNAQGVWSNLATVTETQLDIAAKPNGEYQYRYSLCTLNDNEPFCGEAFSPPITVNVAAIPMIVKTFAWLPAEVEVGEPTVFYWDIENADVCYATTLGTGSALARAAAGQTQAYIFNEPEVHISKWYCLDKAGNRIPSDETQFIEATRTVTANSSKITEMKIDLLGVPAN